MAHFLQHFLGCVPYFLHVPEGVTEYLPEATLGREGGERISMVGGNRYIPSSPRDRSDLAGQGWLQLSGLKRPVAYSRALVIPAPAAEPDNPEAVPSVAS